MPADGPVADPRTLDRFTGALVGVALGDAVGAPFEGRPRVAVADVRAWLEADGPLRWTDDTAMTLALAESLLACGGFDGNDLAQRFTAAYEAEPWRGYAAGPPRIFAALRAGAAWDAPARELFGGAGSFGNGGAMRATPAGLVACGDPAAAAWLGAQQARVTHAHPRGRQGAALLAAAVAVVAAGGLDPADGPDAAAVPDGAEARARRAATLVAAIREAAPEPAFARRLAMLPDLVSVAPRDAARALGAGVAADESVPAALHAFLASPRDVVAVLTYAVCMGGDTDTIAAMAGGLAGADVGLARVPARLRARLEAAERLAVLGSALAATAA
jgi:poly(ADP-ribose) glycohydrolase ARH3